MLIDALKWNFILQSMDLPQQRLQARKTSLMSCRIPSRFLVSKCLLFSCSKLTNSSKGGDPLLFRPGPDQVPVGFQSRPVRVCRHDGHQGWKEEEDSSDCLHDMTRTQIGGPQCTSPASEVSGSTFFRDVPTEVVRQDHHEPLGGQLVAPLPRPGHYHFNQDTEKVN